MTQHKLDDFTKSHGVTVFVPDLKIKAKDKPMSDSEISTLMSKTQNDFRPIKVVMNVALFHQDKPNQDLKTFSKAFKLQVKFKKKDVDDAKGRGANKLKMAYWDGGKWVLLAQKDLSALNEAGSIEADITSWAGDPPIALGT